MNIIPEKSLSSDDVRTVDSRYSTSEYCKGNNNLSTKDKPVYQRKTSNGHIYINENGDVEVLTDITDVINRFFIVICKAALNYAERLLSIRSLICRIFFL